MPGKALLIEGGIGELKGTAADVAAMKDALVGFGFDVQTCDGPAATRDGILAAYRRLIDTVGPKDAAVVYYTGHGGRVTDPSPDLMDLQYIAPYDFYESTMDDFHGISSVELSVLLDELSEKAGNATVILDCCFAGAMSRDAGLRLKALPEAAQYEEVRRHVERLVKAGRLDMTRFRTGGNPRAVRIVACEPYQSAFEGSRNGKTLGLMTAALTDALAAAGSEPVTWATVMDAVRRQVLISASGQRPDVEGPAHRLIFSAEPGDVLDTLPVSILNAGRVRIECAPLLGVQLDDEFMVMPPGAALADPARKVGDLRVDAVGPTVVAGTVAFAPPWTEVPFGARAFRTRVTAPAIPVSVADGPGAADVAKAVTDAPMLRLAGADEPAVAEVRIGDGGELTLHDRVGPLHEPRRGDPAGVAQVVRDLKVLAQATALRGLAGRSQWALGADVAVTWGRVVDGARSPLDPAGATVRAGDPVYISVRNSDPAAVFVSLIDIGVSGRIGVLTRLARGGHRIASGEEWTFGYEELSRTLAGEPLHWPPGLDVSAARPETVLVLVTGEPQDVTPLERPGVARTNESSLEQVIRQLATGRTRTAPRLPGPPVRFDVHTIDFELGPIPDEGGS